MTRTTVGTWGLTWAATALTVCGDTESTADPEQADKSQSARVSQATAEDRLRAVTPLVLLAGPLWLGACYGPTDTATDTASAPIGTDSGTPPDSAPDTATDSDPGDTDSGEPPWQDDLVAVVGNFGEEIRWLERTSGAVFASQELSTWFPGLCDQGGCRAAGFQHHVIDDTDHITLAFSRPLEVGAEDRGGVLSFTPGAPGTLSWEFIELDWDTWLPDLYDGLCAGGVPEDHCRMENPHTVALLPDGAWLVADTRQDRFLVLTVDPTASPVRGVVRAVMDATTLPPSQWERCEGPNNIELWLDGGVTYALTTCRGDTSSDGSMTRRGSLALWDLTDIDDIQRVWRFPKEGYIKAPHHGRVLDGPDGPLVVWGHSMGESGADNEERGSVGLARFHITSRPEYIGDGRLPESYGRFGFVRSVTPLPDGAGLLVADSGCELIFEPCDNPGRLVEVAFPTLTASGLGGAWSEDHADQHFIELEVLALQDGEAVGHPYEAELLAYEDLGEALRTPGAVRTEP